MPAQNQDKLILVVEDNENHMKMISDVLDSSGYRVLKSVDGEEAIVKLNVQDPDIVIADANMPNLSGWKLGVWIKENRKERNIPLIFLNALLDEESASGPGSLGDYYMPKPFNGQRLIAKIEELLTTKKMA